MARKVLGSLFVAALVAVVAVGGVSALSRGAPVQAPVAGQAAERASEAADAAHPNGPAQEEPAQGDAGDAEGAQHITQVIASEFGTTPEEVMSLHEQGIGFGALFKLYSLARAKGVSVNDLLASLPQGEDGHEFAFGKMFKDLSDEQAATLDSGPKNLGQLVSNSHKPESAGEHGQGNGGNH
jgi:hypothetical protein